MDRLKSKSFARILNLALSWFVGIIDSQTLGVTDEDGFEIPVAVSNLTSVHGHGVVAEELDAPKPIQVTFQLLKSITRWNLKIFNNSSLIDHAQLTSCPLLDVSR